MTQRKAKLRHALKADANDHNPLLSARRTESCSQKSEMNTQERRVDQKTEDAPIRMKSILRRPNPQICSGSSGSGSRTGASGFSIGLGGSLIGGGMGSAGVRMRNGGSVGIPDFASRCMAFRCRRGSKGSRRGCLSVSGLQLTRSVGST
jgi:hypothetical protein